MEVGANFCGYERNLEKPGAKDLRGVTFPIHLHQILILKSESDNLITNVNDFTAHSFLQNIVICLSENFQLLYPFANLIFAKTPLTSPNF